MARLDVVLGPEAVGQALRDGRRIVEIHVAQGSPAADGELAAKARAEGIPVRTVPPERLADEAGGDADGVLAYVKSDGYASASDLLEAAEAAGQAPLLLALDMEEEEETVGAVLRVAVAAGVHGVVMPARASGITPTVARAARGALERIKVAKVPNLGEALARLRDKGLRVVGLDPAGGDLADAPLDGGVVLVLPREGHALSPAVASACDATAAVPFMDAEVDLPSAVVAGLALYARRDRTRNRRPVAKRG